MASVPAIGEVIAERYRVERLIGEGGMGAVFQATHVLTGRKLALKWMRSELATDERARTRFIREAHSAGKINHPNVVVVTDAGAHGDSLFIAMELLTGEPLSKLIARGPMAPRACVPLLLQAMRGVSAAHALSVIHRDLKPDNVFLSKRPEHDGVTVKVLDFGIAKADRDANQSALPSLTATGSLVGTPQYMAPEQVMARKDMDHRVDVYALGVIMYQCLSNAIPFYAETLQELIVRIATEAPTPLSEYVRGLPAGLEAVVHKAIARDPKDRYQSVESFARAIEPYADASVQTTVPNPPPPSNEVADTATPFARESAPHLTVEGIGPRQLAVSALGIVLLLGAIWWLTRDPEADAAQAADGTTVAGAPAAAASLPAVAKTTPRPAEAAIAAPPAAVAAPPSSPAAEAAAPATPPTAAAPAAAAAPPVIASPSTAPVHAPRAATKPEPASRVTTPEPARPQAAQASTRARSSSAQPRPAQTAPAATKPNRTSGVSLDDF